MATRRYIYLALGRDKSYVVKKKRFYQSVLWNWYRYVNRMYEWQHMLYAWWVYFSTDSRHSSAYQLCSSSRQLLPLFVWGRLHTGASQKHEKKLDRSFYFPFHYIGDALSLIKLDDFVDHIYPIKVEIKGTHIQLGLRHTLIYTLKNTMSVG